MLADTLCGISGAIPRTGLGPRRATRDLEVQQGARSSPPHVGGSGALWSTPLRPGNRCSSTRLVAASCFAPTSTTSWPSDRFRHGRHTKTSANTRTALGMARTLEAELCGLTDTPNRSSQRILRLGRGGTGRRLPSPSNRGAWPTRWLRLPEPSPFGPAPECSGRNPDGGVRSGSSEHGASDGAGRSCAIRCAHTSCSQRILRWQHRCHRAHGGLRYRTRAGWRTRRAPLPSARRLFEQRRVFSTARRPPTFPDRSRSSRPTASHSGKRCVAAVVPVWAVGRRPEGSTRRGVTHVVRHHHRLPVPLEARLRPSIPVSGVCPNLFGGSIATERAPRPRNEQV